MKRTKTDLSPEVFPAEFHPYLEGCQLYDSSCSSEARVWFLDKDRGYYLKTAPTGTLENEAKMYSYFHSKGLGPQMLGYTQQEADWLLTCRAIGEDCTHEMYLSDPKRLSTLLGELLRQLHDTPARDCPIPNRTEQYLDTAVRNYQTKHFDASLFPDNWGYASAEDAWKVVQEVGPCLTADTLLHGDYCLPNIMLDKWSFSGFIDVGCGGLGDRHIDLFWGLWSLGFNLKTDAYSQRFLDAYGWDAIDQQILSSIGAFEVFG